MSASVLVYLGAMAAMFVGQRLLDGSDAPQSALTLVAVLGLLGAAMMRFRAFRRAKDDGLRLGHRIALVFMLIGVGSLVMYAATTEWVVKELTMAEEAEDRWLGLWRSGWPLVWLLGTVPLLVVDWAIESSPIMMPRRRVTEMTAHGLVAALGIAIAFPLNYVASKTNERWDLAYFRTAEPGTATVALVESLQQPVSVRIFMPPSSEVAQELRDYFEPLQGPNLSVEIIDQAAEPRLAKALSVRDNGVVAFTVGEVDLDAAEPEPPADPNAPAPKAEEDGKAKPITRTIRVGEEFDKAKRTLKKIDAEVQKLLIELGHGERIAYVTTGHGERSWSEQSGVLDQQLTFMKGRLGELGFTVKRLGVQEGLANAVPEDADVVLVLGPQIPLQAAEVDALRRYLQKGGALLIAQEPVLDRQGGPVRFADPLDELVAELGLKLGEGVLASETAFVPVSNNKRDRFFVVTQSFSSHPSNRTLASHSSTDALFSPVAGHLEEIEGGENDVTITARSHASSWADLDLNGEFDADKGESKTARNLMAAIEGGDEGAKWRAIVTADASIFSDLGVGLRGNQMLIGDAMNWLIGAEALSGTTENEEDVKIEHTKEGQSWWFYSTVLGIPLLVLVVGGVRLRMRRVGQPPAESGRPEGGER